MKGFASITLAIRIGMSIIVFVAVWMTFNTYTESIKSMEMTSKMQDVAEYIEAKVFYSLKIAQGAEYAYLKEKVYLPDLREYYSASVGCNGDLLTINASMPVRGINFIIKDYVNCSGMDVSGSLIPGGERCLLTNKSGTAIIIRLVNDCGSV